MQSMDEVIEIILRRKGQCPENGTKEVQNIQVQNACSLPDRKRSDKIPYGRSISKDFYIKKIFKYLNGDDISSEIQLNIEAN